MSGGHGSSYMRFSPSNYFSEKIETDQIHIGKGSLVFKNYWKLKNKISKITLKRIMMRARTENAIAHLKKSSRSPFRDAREQNKKRMYQYGRRTKSDTSPSSLESAHMRSDKKYGLSEWHWKNREEIKIRSVRNERPSLASRDGISKIVHKKWVRQNVTDPLLIKTSKSKSEKVRWHQIRVPMVRRSHFNLLMAHQRNTFRRQDLYDFTFCFFLWNAHFHLKAFFWRPK